ncbi:MAG TPA: homocysteine S-methyltransferase family protein [Microvirga sp.]|jgi:S-methylmethionine-dependent homocysteine/selenocysteine methylase
MTNRTQLPYGTGRTFLTDGGLETTMVFHEGLDLPAFAAFTLLDSEGGRAALDRYFDAYLRIAKQHGLGFVLDTATWRANPDWGHTLGHDAASLDRVQHAALAFAGSVRDRHASAGTPILINGVVGPRGDGYKAEARMTAQDAARYHAPQIEAFRRGGTDLVSAITMTYPEEAIGIAHAAREAGLPAVISFTLETDGRLPSGDALGSAIAAVDAATGGAPAAYMINCAHPQHFAHLFAGDEPWHARIGGLRANASTRSHAELDAATELDMGDPAALGQDYKALRRRLPSLCVLGGCCGTDHRHVAAICEACSP